MSWFSDNAEMKHFDCVFPEKREPSDLRWGHPAQTSERQSNQLGPAKYFSKSDLLKDYQHVLLCLRASHDTIWIQFLQCNAFWLMKIFSYLSEAHEPCSLCAVESSGVTLGKNMSIISMSCLIGWQSTWIVAEVGSDEVCSFQAKVEAIQCFF